MSALGRDLLHKAQAAKEEGVYARVGLMFDRACEVSQDPESVIKLFQNGGIVYSELAFWSKFPVPPAVLAAL